MIQLVLDDVVEHLLQNYKKDPKKIKDRFLDPLICYLMDKMYPYFLISGIVFFLLITLLAMILFLLLRNR